MSNKRQRRPNQYRDAEGGILVRTFAVRHTNGYAVRRILTTGIN